MKMQKPNLFIAGAPKSGTTAFHDFLAQHPEIYMSSRKELCYFCTDFHKESDSFHKKQRYFNYRDERAYLQLFSKCKDAKILGESSTFYFHSKVAANNIFNFNPNSKIIMILRNPVDFIYSLHSHLFVETFEDVQDFRTALSIEEMRRQGKYIPRRVYFPSLLYYTNLIKYHEHVKRYFDVFSTSSIKVIIYDDFKDNNLKVYRDILAFLGVDDNFIPDFQMINVSKKPRNYTINYLMQSDLLIKAMRLILPPRIHSLAKHIAGKALWSEGPRPPMDPQLREQLMNQFRPEVRKISDLLGTDLEKRWYQTTWPLPIYSATKHS